MPGEVPQENFPPEGPALADPSFPHAPVAPPPAQLWRLRDLLLFLAFVPLALLVADLSVNAAYALLKSHLGWQLTREALQTSPFFLLVLQSVFYGFVLGYVYLLVAVNYRQPFWNTLGWRRPTLRGVLGCLGGGIVMAAAVRVAPSVLPDTGSFPLEKLFSSPSAAYAVGGFAILIAPFMEELIFRGVFFAVFERRVGVRFAVLATAVLFAGLHVPEYWGAWNHVFLLFLVGVVFSLARGISGSLAPSVILHVGYNTGMMAGLFFETQHFRTLHVYLLP